MNYLRQSFYGAVIIVLNQFRNNIIYYWEEYSISYPSIVSHFINLIWIKDLYWITYITNCGFCYKNQVIDLLFHASNNFLWMYGNLLTWNVWNYYVKLVKDWFVSTVFSSFLYTFSLMILMIYIYIYLFIYWFIL